MHRRFSMYNMIVPSPQRLLERLVHGSAPHRHGAALALAKCAAPLAGSAALLETYFLAAVHHCMAALRLAEGALHLM